MAEAVLFGIAQEIITKLGSQAIQEISQWWGFKDELEKLNRTVSTIKAVLLHAEQQSMESVQVKDWLAMLKEAIYDADDLLDEISTDALQKQMLTGNRTAKKVSGFFSGSNRFVYGLKMSHKIKIIRNRLDEIAGNRRFHLEERSGERIVKAKDREQTHSSTPEVVIGREHDKEAIIHLLLSSNFEENVSVVPIVGIGGLGKTTLAQLVYNDERVKMHFELRKWACISDDFDVKLIVEKLVSSEGRNSEMEALKDRLHQQINGKKYLMVLDDVWNEDSEKWFRLKDLLVGGARGSKIVLTTRLRKVAEMTRPIAVHELRGLSDMESWSLFRQIAFKRGQVLTLSHESIAKEIVAKCSGVPLAIKTMGGFLYFKDSESEWLSFKNTELSRIDQKESDILPTLKLSYSHLPSHLKQCFAYCKLFPKDYRIGVEMLIQLWIAQGYVKSSDPIQCLGDIGVEYFTDLLWRSFFQDVEKDDFGNYKTCKMHDLMHDLATLVAGEECASSCNSEVAFRNAKTRHVSIHFDSNSQWTASLSSFKAKKLRTFLQLVSRGRPHITTEQFNEMFLNLRCLRVLDLNRLQMVTLPSSIDKLKHLRYLDLSYGWFVSRFSRSELNMRTLPDSITKLQNLQVLKLDGRTWLIELPNDIKKLVNLTHLSNDSCHGLRHMPRGIGQLTSLEKLSRFVVAKDSSVSKHSAGLSELQWLNKLRGNLSIVNLPRDENVAIECKAANLKAKPHLQKLVFEWSSDSASAGEVENEETALEALEPHQYLKGLSVNWYRGVKLPSWLLSLTNLVEICFWDCENIKRLPAFDHLPSLKRLLIFKLANLEYMDVVIVPNSGDVFFPSLQELSLDQCPNLKGWNLAKAELLQFYCLSTLRILSCPNLTSMPLSPSLKELTSTAKLLEQALNTTILASESSSSSPTLSEVEALTISRVEDTEFLPKLLLCSLASLGKLYIKECPGITVLTHDDNGDEMQWGGLKSLHCLKLEHIPNLGSLPRGLQYVSSLRRLTISKCPKLRSLPDWMHSLSYLQFLDIEECPQLSQRCENNTAEDWPKIAHIPDIMIEGKSVQKNGSYLL